MWLAFVLILIIALCAFAFFTGTIWMAIPVLLLAFIAFMVYLAGIRETTDGRAGAIESGGYDPKGDPQESTSGQTHERTGYAHEGQAHTGA
jgi:hypothetical protein